MPAPNSPHAGSTPQQLATQAGPADPLQRPERSSARFLWALLLARIRIYEILPLRCMLCGADMRIAAFITEAPAVNTILGHLGEPTSPPETAPARGPRLWDQAAEPVPDWGDSPAPLLAFVFDQWLVW